VRSGARRLRRRSRRFVGRFLVVALLIGGAFAVVTLYRVLGGGWSLDVTGWSSAS